MNPFLVFWIPAILRIAIAAGIAVACGYYFGAVYGFLLALLAMSGLVVIQLRYLYGLNQWLDNPHSERLPDGWGAWNTSFARLYALHREGERSQADLTEWLSRFRQTMNLLPDGVLLMKDVLFLEWCNPVAERHLGVNLETDKGMRVTNLVRHPDFINYIVLGVYDQPLKMTFQDRDLLIQIIPFDNRRQIMVTNDATESERIEIMRRDFVANASHELRTPLSVINGFLEIASMQPDLDQDVRLEHIALMREQGDRMQRIIEDMLKLSKLESIDFTLKVKKVDTRQLLKLVETETNLLSAGQHKVTLTIDAPDIMGNEEELKTAFCNLASNAVRYTPAGGQINIVWHKNEAGVVFAVKDTGIGVAPEHISRLTERFYRVDSQRSQETRGSGLGLAIVRHIILRHKGELRIESELGKGSIFSAQFPASIMIE